MDRGEPTGSASDLTDIVPEAAKRYRDELMAEVNADREAHGKKPFDDDDPPKGTKRQTTHRGKSRPGGRRRRRERKL